jgi:hypothetical protein
MTERNRQLGTKRLSTIFSRGYVIPVKSLTITVNSTFRTYLRCGIIVFRFSREE